MKIPQNTPRATGQAAHTPTPWFADGETLLEDSAAYGRIAIAKFSHPIFRDSGKDNAAFAARACNSYAANQAEIARLREALEALSGEYGFQRDLMTPEWCVIARAALAQTSKE